MELETYLYDAKNGWNHPLNSDLDSRSTLIIAFGCADPTIIQTGLNELKQAFPLAQKIGCSSAGEIYHTEIHDNTISVAIVKFHRTTIKTTTIHLTGSDNIHNAGKSLATQLLEDNLNTIFLLSDGLNSNGTKLAEGINDTLTHPVVVTGGLAADDDRFVQTWTFDSDLIPRQNELVAIGLYGDHNKTEHSFYGGWDVLGIEREVTRSSDNILFELDGQPALALYKKYLGDRAAELPASGLLFPLTIVNDDATETVRTILSINEEEQSITFAGDLPQGCRVQLMKANFDRLIDGAAIAGENITQSSQKAGQKLCIAISCIGRRLVLNQSAEEEVEAVAGTLSADTSLIGYYSYGEISPIANGYTALHNQTMTLTLFTED